MKSDGGQKEEEILTHVDTQATSTDEATGGKRPASAHSPLPWEVGPADDQRDGRVCGVGNEFWTLADMNSLDDEPTLTPKIAKANAEFIVKACNHFDELSELVHEASEIMNITYAGNFPAGIESFLIRASRLLAKVQE